MAANFMEQSGASKFYVGHLGTRSNFYPHHLVGGFDDSHGAIPVTSFRSEGAEHQQST